MKKEQIKNYITYQKAFWLFMIANVLGVILEGIWCLYRHGHWESHVVTVYGPFCLIYGLGALVLYFNAKLQKKSNMFIQFTSAAILCDVVEYICGFMLEYGLHMKAWDYKRRAFNLHGYISLDMTIMWGLLGLIFIYVIVPKYDKFFDKIKGYKYSVICNILVFLMILNMSLTSVAIIRWKDRHFSIPPNNKIEEKIDKKYNDEFMSNKFIEWWFVK